MIVNCTKKATRREDMRVDKTTLESRLRDILLTGMNSTYSDPHECIDSMTINLLRLFSDERRYGR